MSAMRPATWAVVMLSAATASVGPAHGTEQVIHLKDHIDHAWSNELVTYTLTFRRGACHRSSIAVVGPDGPVPFQLHEADVDRQGFVRTARLSFVTDLPALGERVFRVRFGPQPVESAKAAETDLRVVEHGRIVEFTTRRAGVRLLVGRKRFSSPVAPDAVPGPVMGIRTLEGQWIGGSRLYGRRRIAGYRGHVEAAGPVFAEATVTYTYETGDTLVVTARVVAGQEVVFMTAESGVHAPDDGWRLVLDRAFADLTLSVVGEYLGRLRSRWRLPHGQVGHVRLADEPAGVIYSLVPWEDWWDNATRTVFSLSSPTSRTVLAVGSRDPGAWNDPAWVDPARRDQYPFVPTDHWKRRVFKAMGLVKGARGHVFLDCSARLGTRKWFVGALPKQADPTESYLRAVALHDGKYGCQTLDEVKDYILDWAAEASNAHPRLYVSVGDRAAARAKLGAAEQIEARFCRPYRSDDGKRLVLCGRKLLAYMVDSAYMAPRHLETLEHNPNKFDLMRHGGWLVNLFDALAGTGELAESEHRRLRAQIAFLGYRLDSPHVWDLPRGFAGDENNMHMSYMCNLGLVACALPAHPRAQAWAKKAIRWVRRRLAERVGPNGVWTCENLHYANVSLASILPFAIAAQHAGFHKFLQDGTLRSFALYIVKQLTPPDPRYGNVRSQPPEPVQDRAERTALAGVIAKATAALDPDFSKTMQWAWLEQGGHRSVMDARTIGFEHVLTDKALPAAQPDWTSEHFPKAGVILRHGLGTPDENYLSLPLAGFGNYYQAQPGALTIYAKGKPLAMAFSGSYQVFTGEAFLTNTVSLARTPGSSEDRAKNKGHFPKGRITAFSGLARQDYAMAAFRMEHPVPVRPFFRHKLPPLPAWPRLVKQATGAGATWQRQVLFIKGARSGDAAWFLVRDTVSGGQPTACRYWTLSQKIGAPGEVEGLDAPGNRATPARQLTGNRFTAIGQFDVDLDYYVALPRGTPRATLRWGYDVTGSWPNPWHEYQDLLHLQRTDDGAYLVALFPRRRNEQAPRFETLGGGLVVSAAGPFGADYGFLSATPAEANVAGMHFRGTAASVQSRAEGLVLCLGAKGEAAHQGYRLASSAGAELQVRKERLTVSVSPDHAPGQTVTLGVPKGIAVAHGGTHAPLRPSADNTYRIVLPAGRHTIPLLVRAVRTLYVD